MQIRIPTPTPPRFEVLGLGFQVLGLGFEVLGLGFEVVGLGFQVLGLGFEVLGLRFEVLSWVPRFWGWGSSFWGWGSRFWARGFEAQRHWRQKPRKTRGNLQNESQGGRGTFKNTSETRVSLIYTCFYVFLSIWLGRPSAGKGGRGIG